MPNKISEAEKNLEYARLKRLLELASRLQELKDSKKSRTIKKGGGEKVEKTEEEKKQERKQERKRLQLIQIETFKKQSNGFTIPKITRLIWSNNSCYRNAIIMSFYYSAFAKRAIFESQSDSLICQLMKGLFEDMDANNNKSIETMHDISVDENKNYVNLLIALNTAGNNGERDIYGDSKLVIDRIYNEITDVRLNEITIYEEIIPGVTNIIKPPEHKNSKYQLSSVILFNGGHIVNFVFIYPYWYLMDDNSREYPLPNTTIPVIPGYYIAGILWERVDEKFPNDNTMKHLQVDYLNRSEYIKDSLDIKSERGQIMQSFDSEIAEKQKRLDELGKITDKSDIQLNEYKMLYDELLNAITDEKVIRNMEILINDLLSEKIDAHKKKEQKYSEYIYSVMSQKASDVTVPDTKSHVTGKVQLSPNDKVDFKDLLAARRINFGNDDDDDDDGVGVDDDDDDNQQPQQPQQPPPRVSFDLLAKLQQKKKLRTVEQNPYQKARADNKLNSKKYKENVEEEKKKCTDKQYFCEIDWKCSAPASNKDNVKHYSTRRCQKDEIDEMHSYIKNMLGDRTDEHLAASIDDFSNDNQPPSSPPPSQLALQSALQSAPQSAPQSALQSVLRSAPQLALQSAPQSALQSVLRSAPQLAPRSAPQLALQSAPQSALQSVLRSAPQSVLRSALQSAPQSALQSVLRSAPQLALQSAPTQTTKYLIGLIFTHNNESKNKDEQNYANNKYIMRPDIYNTITIPTLVIYNEDFKQYMNINYTEPGGGNAAIRPLRSDAPNKTDTNNLYVLGIPTSSHQKKFQRNASVENYTQPIDTIRTLIQQKNIEVVIFSMSDNEYTLGMQIFQDNPYAIDNRNYYFERLIQILDNDFQKFYFANDAKEYKMTYNNEDVKRLTSLKQILTQPQPQLQPYPSPQPEPSPSPQPEKTREEKKNIFALLQEEEKLTEDNINEHYDIEIDITDKIEEINTLLQYINTKPVYVDIEQVREMIKKLRKRVLKYYNDTINERKRISISMVKRMKDKTYTCDSWEKKYSEYKAFVIEDNVKTEIKIIEREKHDINITHTEVARKIKQNNERMEIIDSHSQYQLLYIEENKLYDIETELRNDIRSTILKPISNYAFDDIMKRWNQYKYMYMRYCEKLKQEKLLIYWRQSNKNLRQISNVKKWMAFVVKWSDILYNMKLKNTPTKDQKSILSTSYYKDRELVEELSLYIKILNRIILRLPMDYREDASVLTDEWLSILNRLPPYDTLKLSEISELLDRQIPQLPTQRIISILVGYEEKMPGITVPRLIVILSDRKDNRPSSIINQVVRRLQAYVRSYPSIMLHEIIENLTNRAKQIKTNVLTYDYTNKAEDIKINSRREERRKAEEDKIIAAENFIKQQRIKEQEDKEREDKEREQREKDNKTSANLLAAYTATNARKMEEKRKEMKELEDKREKDRIATEAERKATALKAKEQESKRKEQERKNKEYIKKNTRNYEPSNTVLNLEDDTRNYEPSNTVLNLKDDIRKLKKIIPKEIEKTKDKFPDKKSILPKYPKHPTHEKATIALVNPNGPYTPSDTNELNYYAFITPDSSSEEENTDDEEKASLQAERRNLNGVLNKIKTDYNVLTIEKNGNF